MQKATKEKQTKAERCKGNISCSERLSAKWFCCALKLGFLQLICQASLIFNSNLELALSIILKHRELYESKHVSEDRRCFKLWYLLYFLTSSSILVLKWRQVSPMWLELQLVKTNLYTRQDFKSLGIGYLYGKCFLILTELKTSLMSKFFLQNSLQSFKSLFLIWCKRLPIYGNLIADMHF